MLHRPHISRLPEQKLSESKKRLSIRNPESLRETGTPSGGVPRHRSIAKLKPADLQYFTEQVEENVNPGFAFFIMLNNYFHDIATALLLASGVAVWMIRKQAAASGNTHIRAFVLDTYRSMSKIIFFALAWISISAIPRILAFTRLEWASAHDKNQVVGLAAKHILAFIIIVGGCSLWISISRTMKGAPGRAETPASRRE
jgi:hypothetical protein